MNIKFGCAMLRAIELEDIRLLQHLMNDPGVESMRSQSTRRKNGSGSFAMMTDACAG